MNGSSQYEKAPAHMIELAKNLRRNQTDAETVVWNLLRNRQVANAKFRRQHPIEGYIADFYCDEYQLVIELDGGQHFTDAGIKKDTERTQRLNELGINVLRFDNRQVLTETETVLQMIYDALTPALSRKAGEGVKDTHSDAGTFHSPKVQR
jgi:very-short-patch-repair endonuclease